METPDYAGQSLALDDTRLKLVELNGLAEKFGTAMTRAFASGIAHGKSLDAVLHTVGQKFIEIGLRAGLQPLEGLVTSSLGGLTRGLAGSFGSLFGGGVSGPVMPFADGGVIASPSYFPLGRGTGLAGEAGPEAILPLSRGADGRLGVAASGGGGAAPVYVTIQTPDIAGFTRSESQVSAALAKAVARGRRAT